MSNKQSKTYKRKYLSFTNKGVMLFIYCLLLLVMIPFSKFVFDHWSEVPIFIKIFWPIIMLVIATGIITTPLNGMFLTKNGTIFFVPDFRIKKTHVEELERIAFTFNEWENEKYSVTVKFVYKDGKVFIKEYSKQFRNAKNKNLSMSVYTIEKRKVDKICEELADLNICYITIVDRDYKIIYQNK